MNIDKCIEMINDKHFLDLKKMQYKYTIAEVSDLISFMDKMLFEKITLSDFSGKKLVYIPTKAIVTNSSFMKLVAPNNSDAAYSLTSMEDEIFSTFAIENIDSSRNSVRNILKGFTPKNNEEEVIYSMKKGLDFIADKKNIINEENLYQLYNMTIGKHLDDDTKLQNESYYRHGEVFVVGIEVEHQGIDHKLLPKYVKELINFINENDEINSLQKACMIHYQFAYLHPYFDGNGRTARMLQLWYLVQNGFDSTLFTSFSKQIAATKKDYYKSFTIIADNYRISKKLDITPFITYFSQNVYNKIIVENNSSQSFNRYEEALNQGLVSEKETKLFKFVISNYGNTPFSTKQLEKDYRDVAYETVRKFVLKFEQFGVLNSQKFGSRVKYNLTR